MVDVLITWLEMCSEFLKPSSYAFGGLAFTIHDWMKCDVPVCGRIEGNVVRSQGPRSPFQNQLPDYRVTLGYSEPQFPTVREL